MKPFSEATLSYLREAGWTEDRGVDISSYVRYLEEHGISASLAVREFLGRFGGLEIANPICPRGQGVGRYSQSGNEPFLIDSGVVFESVGTVNTSDDAWLPLFEGTVGVALCPIGFCEGGNESLVLLMAEDGRVFVGTDEQGYLWRVADAGTEAVEVICNGDLYGLQLKRALDSGKSGRIIEASVVQSA